MLVSKSKKIAGCTEKNFITFNVVSYLIFKRKITGFQQNVEVCCLYFIFINCL